MLVVKRGHRIVGSEFFCEDFLEERARGQYYFSDERNGNKSEVSARKRLQLGAKKEMPVKIKDNMPPSIQLPLALDRDSH